MSKTFWMSIYMFMVLSVVLACSSNDEEDESGIDSKRTSSFTIDGKTYDIHYAYWEIVDGESHVSFFNTDMRSVQTPPETLTSILLEIKNEDCNTGIPIGTINNFFVYVWEKASVNYFNESANYQPTYTISSFYKSNNSRFVINKNENIFDVDVWVENVFTSSNKPDKHTLSLKYHGEIEKKPLTGVADLL